MCGLPRFLSLQEWIWPDENDELSPTEPYRTNTSWWARGTLTWAQEQFHQGTFPRGAYRVLAEVMNIILGGEVMLYFDQQEIYTANLIK